MARPQKFRIPIDEVIQADNARKVAGHVAEIEFFREEVEKLQAQIAGVYDAADDDGFDKKFIRKLVARRAKDENEFAAEEQGIEIYAQAVEKGLATRAREENPEHDAETGEITEPDSTASIPPEVAADAEEQTHSSNASSSAPIQPKTQGEPNGEGAQRESREVGGEAGDEGNSGGSDHESERRLHSAPSERPEQAGDHALAGSGDALATEGYPANPGRAPEAQGLVLPVASNVTQFARPKTAAEYRTHCQNPTACAGIGRNHCFTCDRAHAAGNIPHQGEVG